MMPRGFTLLEMLVVLLIMVALATLAFSTVETLDDRMKHTETIDTLQKLENAITQTYKDKDGKQLLTGFLPDMGRLPKQSGTDGMTMLKELWDGTGLPTAQRLSAPESNPIIQKYENGKIVSKGPRSSFAISTGSLKPFDNKDVAFSFGGWKGPYMKLGIGKEVLADGWGNPFKLEFASDGQLKKITSLGADNREGEITGDSYSKDVAIQFNPVPLNTRHTVTGRIQCKGLNESKHLVPQLQIFQASEDGTRVEFTAYLFQDSEVENGSTVKFTLTNRRPGRMVLKATQENVEYGKEKTITPKDNPLVEVTIQQDMPEIVIQLD